MPDSNITYFAYLRKSSESKERQALSIDAQQRKIEEYFPDLDIEFITEERSAFKPFNRPFFTSMLERIEQGERQGLIAWHPDRLSRNELDAAKIVHMLRNGHIRDLKFATYPFHDTPEGILALQNALSHSQYQSAKKSRDVKRGLEQKALQGHPPYPAIVGYRNTPHLERGFKQWEEDPERFQLARRLWDLILTGLYTRNQLYRIATKDLGLTSPVRRSLGGKPITRSALYRLFRERAYAGRFEYPKKSGNWYDGAYPAMITEAEFLRVQEMLDGRAQPELSQVLFAFRGVFWCGACDAQVTAERKVRSQCPDCGVKFSALNRQECPQCSRPVAETRIYHYYHCTHRKTNVTCNQRSVREEIAIAHVDPVLEEIWVPEPITTWRPHADRTKEQEEIQAASRLRKELIGKLDDIAEKLDRLVELRVAGELSPQELTRARNRLSSQRDQITVEIEKLKGDSHRGEQRIEHLLKVAHEGYLAIRTDKIKNYKPYIDALIEEGSKPLILDGEPIFQWAKWTSALQRLSKTAARVHRGFETRKRRLTERQIHGIYDRCPCLLPD